jgi:hypothetical protein
MEFGIFNLIGSRDPAKPTAEVFAEQTRLGYEGRWPTPLVERALGPLGRQTAE